MKLISPYNLCPTPFTTLVPKPNLFISMGTLILPVHREKLRQIQLIRFTSDQQNIIFLPRELNSKKAEEIFLFFYGYNIDIADKNSLFQILDIIQFLGIPKLNQIVQDLLINQLNNSDVFPTLTLAYSYGLDNLLKAVFNILTRQQFQLCRIYQYSLLQTEFKLFQIIIRRHHRLKMQKKIQGLPAEVVEEIISMYCRRYHYCKQIEQKLVQNYVKPLKNWKKEDFKGSLKLNKMLGKNIGQSTTIYGNDSQKRSKDEELDISPSSNFLNTHPNSNLKGSDKKTDSFRSRKYSVEMEKALVQIGLQQANNMKSNILSGMEEISGQGVHIIPEEDQMYIEDLIKQYELKDSGKMSIEMGLADQQIDKCIDDISQIGNKGSVEFKIHEIDCRQLISLRRRSNTKSVIFHQVIEVEQSIQQSMENKCKKYNKTLNKFGALPGPYNA